MSSPGQATDQASLLLGKQLKGGLHAVHHWRMLSPLLAVCILKHSSLNQGGLHDPAELTKRPVDGFSAGLVSDDNLFEWQVTVMGPPDTL